jgi:hypothetical protein
LQNKLNSKSAISRKYFLVFSALLLIKTANAQIANYIQNGSMEQMINCNAPNNVSKAKYWRSIDSVNYGNSFLESTCYPNVPYGTFGYQWSKNGGNHLVVGMLCTPPACLPYDHRGYIRNRLKSNLINGKTYCVKFYVNITDNSSYGIDAFGAFFGDNSLDTITKMNIPLTYLNPQIKNPTGNVITDTMNWTLITGTFVATGIEKHCVIGNFKSDAATNKTFINNLNFPSVYTNVLVDAVSCIPTDLPAYAGADIWGIPSTTVYIGRQRDVGIDEACTWYNMSNTLTPIANAAGLTLTVALSTQTYIVKQDICGIIKYDTVVVFASALGNTELQYFKDQIKVYPQPAKDKVSIELTANDIAKNYTEFVIYTSLGQAIRREELEFTKKLIKQVDVTELPNGYYTIQLHTTKGYVINQSLIISR